MTLPRDMDRRAKFIRPSAAFCCDECGHIHMSEHTVLDTFCPNCESPRENQTLAQCLYCSMPCFPHQVDDQTTWLHCDEDLDDDCRHYPRINHLRGLKRRKT